MKKPSYKKILAALEDIRNGLVQFYMAAATHNDFIFVSCVEAHYKAVNKIIVELGGESTELADLKSLMQK